MPKNSEISELLRDVREQVLYLQELGISGLGVELEPPKSPKNERLAQERFVPDEIPVVKVPSTPRTNTSRLANLPSLSKAARERPESAERIPATDVQAVREKQNTQTMFGDIAPTLNETTDTIESIRAEIGDCRRCELCGLGRKQIVHSTGNVNAELMFVGEAPGADEDEQGFPFVGRAGQLLTKIIEGIGMKRDEVFIGNINRCRPPGNRQPLPAETAACRPFLLREVAVVRPKVIVVMGNTATQNLLGVRTPISKLRGHFQEYFGVKVMPTFHPAYLLRDPHKKREVWEDMKKVRDYLNSI
jgi:DNA polymerase